MLISIKVKKNGYTIDNRVHTSKRNADAEFRAIVKECQMASGGNVTITQTFCGMSADIVSLFDTFKVVTFECIGSRNKVNRFRTY